MVRIVREIDLEILNNFDLKTDSICFPVGLYVPGPMETAPRFVNRNFILSDKCVTFQKPKQRDPDDFENEIQIEINDKVKVVVTQVYDYFIRKEVPTLKLGLKGGMSAHFRPSQPEQGNSFFVKILETTAFAILKKKLNIQNSEFLWTPTNHSLFFSQTQKEVFFLLLCINRHKKTNAKLFDILPNDMIKLILNEIAGIVPFTRMLSHKEQKSFNRLKNQELIKDIPGLAQLIERKATTNAKPEAKSSFFRNLFNKGKLFNFE